MWSPCESSSSAAFLVCVCHKARFSCCCSGGVCSSECSCSSSTCFTRWINLTNVDVLRLLTQRFSPQFSAEVCFCGRLWLGVTESSTLGTSLCVLWSGILVFGFKWIVLLPELLLMGECWDRFMSTTQCLWHTQALLVSYLFIYLGLNLYTNQIGLFHWLNWTE